MANPTSNIMKFTSERQRNLAFELMNDFRQSGELCDIVLKVGSSDAQPIHSHRVVLASSSPYFRAMLTCGLAESKQKEIIIKEIDENALRILIEFFYTSKLTIDENNVQNLFVASCLLQMDEIKAKCSKFLRCQLSPSNCLGMRALGSTYSCPKLFRTADSILKRHFAAVVASEEFRLLPLESLIEILKSADNLHVSNEVSIFRTVMIWLKNQTFAERPGFLRQLIPYVKLELLSAKFLKEKVSAYPWIKGDKFCRDLVENAIAVGHSLPREDGKSLKRKNPDAEIGGQFKRLKIERIPKLTGFDLGYEAEKIIDVRDVGDPAQRMVTMKWKDVEETELVPVYYARTKYPELFIQYMISYLRSVRDNYKSSRVALTTM